MNANDDFYIRSFRTDDESALIDLWHRCGLVRPWNDPARDISRKRMVQPELFLVGVAGDTVIASAMIGYDGHRGWLNYLAVDPSFQRRGFACRIVSEAEQRLRALGCPKLNLQVRADNAAAMAFYKALGYIRDDVVSFGRRLQNDEPPASRTRLA